MRILLDVEWLLPRPVYLLFHSVSNFLRDRTFQVRIQSSLSSLPNLNDGVLQGAVFSPIFFNIAISDLLLAISPLVSVAIFANDLALFLPCNSILWSPCPTRTTQQSLFHWSVQNGFTFSAAKLARVNFCRLHSCQRQSHFFLDSTSIASATTVRSLGLVFEETFGLKKHIP